MDLELELRPQEFTEAEMVLEVRGTAVFEDVEVPIPGIGRLSDLTLQVWGLITMTPVA